MPDELQVVSIPIIEQDTCAELYKEWDLLYDGEVCAVAPDQGSCNVRSTKNFLLQTTETIQLFLYLDDSRVKQ